jgi:hypothetical protein
MHARRVLDGWARGRHDPVSTLHNSRGTGPRGTDTATSVGTMPALVPLSMPPRHWRHRRTRRRSCLGGDGAGHLASPGGRPRLAAVDAHRARAWGGPLMTAGLVPRWSSAARRASSARSWAIGFGLHRRGRRCHRRNRLLTPRPVHHHGASPCWGSRRRWGGSGFSADDGERAARGGRGPTASPMPPRGGVRLVQAVARRRGGSGQLLHAVPDATTRPRFWRPCRPGPAGWVIG